MKNNNFKTIVLALAGAGLISLPSITLANPQGGQVVAGSATIRQETPTKVGITQTTDKAIIDWKSFSIGANEQTRFYQPSASSVTLNRVTGEDPSQILGRLTANGQVFLVNPNGIYFGKNAQIDVAGLVATTHNIRNEDFLAGKYLFNIPGKPGAAVINEGTIRIADTGVAAFVAPSVANRGVIAAKLGKVALASANGFTLDFHGDELLTFLVSDEVAQTAFDIEGKQLTSFVENSGKIEAQGGYVLLTAKAAENAIHGVINQSGVIEATSVGQQNGEIILSGGQHGVVSNTGTLDASGKGAGETGGKVQITGEKIGLFSGTKIDVSGDQGGGKAIIGGDYLGGKASDALIAELGIQREKDVIQTAAYTNMASDAVINADAINNGKGGKVVLWSDNRTLAHGAITAKGGGKNGDGGFIEVSGQKQLDIAGIKIDASSKQGKAGTVLYDPGNVYITDDSQAVASYNVADFTSTTPWGGRTNIAASNIEATLNNGTSVVIRGNPGTPGNDGAGQIYIQKSIHKTRGGNAMLSLFAADEIYLYNGVDITSTSGKLDVYMDADYDRYSYGLIDLQTGSAIRTNGGFVNINGSDIYRNGVIDTTVTHPGSDGNMTAGTIRQAHDYFERVDFSLLRNDTISFSADKEEVLVAGGNDGTSSINNFKEVTLQEWIKPDTSRGQTDSVKVYYTNIKGERVYKEVSSYPPVDSSDFTYNGNTVTLSAYPNLTTEGSFDANGDHQCTQLIQRYVTDVFGLNSIALGNGKAVAANLAKNYPENFDNIQNGGGKPPVIGSVLSMEYGSTGHVAIVKALKEVKDKNGNVIELKAQLIEQNVETNSGMAINRVISFVKDSNGNWTANHKTSQKGKAKEVYSWANPISQQPQVNNQVPQASAPHLSEPPVITLPIPTTGGNNSSGPLTGAGSVMQ